MAWRALRACGRSRVPASIARSKRCRRTRSPVALARSGHVGSELADHIRQQIAASRLHGEGYRKLWARLRFAGVRASPRRVRRVMGENGLLAPHRVGRAESKPHDGTIITNKVNEMWGTDMTQTITVAEGRAYVFVAVEHANSEVVGIHTRNARSDRLRRSSQTATGNPARTSRTSTIVTVTLFARYPLSRLPKLALRPGIAGRSSCGPAGREGVTSTWASLFWCFIYQAIFSQPMETEPGQPALCTSSLRDGASDAWAITHSLTGWT